MLYLQAVRSAPQKLPIGNKITKKGKRMAPQEYNKLSIDERLHKGLMINKYIFNGDSRVIKFIRHF